jgi:hypothetical protein
MNPIALVLLWIFILAIILLSTPTKCPAQTEGFDTYYGYYKRYCPTCGWRSRASCSKCLNCGWSINAAGQGQCVPGDSSGPYYTDDTMYWEYGNDNNFYYPYSHIYPVVKVRSIYPYYNYKLRKPWYVNRNRINKK